MTEVVEGGTTLAWRLLATLEGGSLLLATTALLAYSARKRVARVKRMRRPRTIHTVLLTNSTNRLGKELKTQLEARGCVVSTVPSDASSGAGTEATRTAEPADKVDALIVVGAYTPPKQTGLQGMAQLVTEDVYSNLKVLESLAARVKKGGYLAWACAGAPADGSFRDVGEAFDEVLRTNLHHVASQCGCEAVWAGRGERAERAAARLLAALLPAAAPPHGLSFTIRNAAHKVGEYLGRWLKIVS